MIGDIENGKINMVVVKDLSRLGRNYIMCGQYIKSVVLCGGEYALIVKGGRYAPWTHAARTHLKDAFYDKINMVVVKDLSRLGRNYIMCGQYTEIYFPEKGVRFIAVNDNVDTINNTGSMDITPFKHILNDMYAKDISTKIILGDNRFVHTLDDNPILPVILHPFFCAVGRCVLPALHHAPNKHLILQHGSTKIKSSLHMKAMRGEYLGALDPYGYVRDRIPLTTIQSSLSFFTRFFVQ